jgi:tetrahydromethanopterin S-methyltransferase subunit F
MDIAAFIIGFIIGVISVGVAIELGMRKTVKTQPASRPTHTWSISEISNPRIMAEYLGDIEIPENAKIVVKEYEDENTLEGRNVKKHSGIRGNFILGDDRALILAGPVKKDELGIWTVEKTMLDKLNRYFEDSWSKARTIKTKEQ